jgi:hypothetical protein
MARAGCRDIQKSLFPQSSGTPPRSGGPGHRLPPADRLSGRSSAAQTALPDGLFANSSVGHLEPLGSRPIRNLQASWRQSPSRSLDVPGGWSGRRNLFSRCPLRAARYLDAELGHSRSRARLCLAYCLGGESAPSPSSADKKPRPFGLFATARVARGVIKMPPMPHRKGNKSASGDCSKIAHPGRDLHKLSG